MGTFFCLYMKYFSTFASVLLHMDLNAEKFDRKEQFGALLSNQLEQWEDLYGKGEGETTFSLRFKGVIRRAFQQTGRPVIILIDEYDKPMLQALDNDELQKEFRDTLKAFYGVMSRRRFYEVPAPFLCRYRQGGSTSWCVIWSFITRMSCLLSAN